MITVSHPTFCCVGVVVEVGFGFDNYMDSEYLKQGIYQGGDRSPKGGGG